MKILLGILMACAFACTKQPKSSTSGYVTDGIEFKWPVNPMTGVVEVPVCWENMPASEARQRSWVQNIVTREYGKLKFSFQGWDACPAESRGIRIVSIDGDSNKTANFGFKLAGKPMGMVLNLAFPSEHRSPTCHTDQAAFQVCIEINALHEFGHGIGLRHEADRPDSSCKGDMSFGAGEQGALAVGQYDPDSIMNYCATGQLTKLPKHSPSLSSGDVSAISEYYFGQAQSPVFSSSRALCENEGNQWDNSSALGNSCCRVTFKENQPPTITNDVPYKYCGLPINIDVSKLDMAKLPSLKSETDATPCGLQAICEYASGRRTYSYMESHFVGEIRQELTLGLLKSKRSVITEIEPQNGPYSCEIFLYTGNGNSKRVNRAKGQFEIDPSVYWPEDDTPKISDWHNIN